MSIFTKSVEGRTGILPGKAEKKASELLPSSLLRKDAPKLAELSELDVVRHYTNLSKKNFGVDSNFYPLGSCTMKYNPKFMESVAGLAGFTFAHPLLGQLAPQNVQGSLELIYNMERLLCEINGLAAFTMHGMAGAHGEWIGVMMIAAYHKDKGNKKTKIICPDAAHGTNPASAALAGFEVINIESVDGMVDADKLEEALTDDVAAVMMTCPNTLGLFERHLPKVVEKLRKIDALLYYDGANANAILGKMRVGDVGFDVVHHNLHKTFGTPHGGGGPGSGPVGVSERLVPYLPISRVVKNGDEYALSYDFPKSIGFVTPFYGSFGVFLKAYAYIMLLGSQGLTRAAEYSVLNANYLRKKLENILTIPYNRICLHEFVAQPSDPNVRALDIAKALLDEGIHAPTVYFPLIVKECLMIEPTETENKETLDNFVEVIAKIMELGKTDLAKLLEAPTKTSVRRVDEVKAARDMIITEPVV